MTDHRLGTVTNVRSMDDFRPASVPESIVMAKAVFDALHDRERSVIEGQLYDSASANVDCRLDWRCVAN